MNKKFLIDYIQLYRNQLNKLYKLLQTDDKYDEKLINFIRTSVLKNEQVAYDILKRLSNNKETDYDIKHLNNLLNDILSLVDTGLSVKNHEAKKQLEKCINYSRILEAILLDTLPDIESEYYIASTLSIELLENLNDLIK